MTTLQRTTFASLSALAVVGVVSALTPGATVFADDADAKPQVQPAEMLVRDPFWPVGYKPKPKVDNANTNGTAVTGNPVEQPPEPPPEDPPKWPELRITGTMKYPDGQWGATLGGIKGLITAGQTVSKSDGKYEYFWKIESISASRLQATRLSVKKLR